MIRIALLLTALTLASCTPTQQATNPTERQQASAYINSWVAQRFGPEPAAAFTQCVLQNASATDILSIENSLSLGQSRAADATISEIVARPGTHLCVPPIDLSVQGRLVRRP